MPSSIRIEANDFVTDSDPAGTNPAHEGLGGALLYDVMIPQAGTYRLFAQVKSTLTHHLFPVAINDVSSTLTFDRPNAWQTLSLTSLRLEAGRQPLRFELPFPEIELNYVDLIPVNEAGEPHLQTVPRLALNDELHHHTSSIGEVGQLIGITHQRQTITLEREYLNPVVLVQSLSSHGKQPAIVRLSNLQSNSFDLFLQEPSNLDGKHIPEDVSYLVLESGSWLLEDGTKIEVGTLDSKTLVKTGFEAVSFEQDFEQTPVLFSQVQTFNGADFVRTRQRQTTDTGFQVGLEEEEKKQFSGHVTESIGWLAIESGSGDWNGLNYQAGYTGDRVTDQWSSIDLEGFETAPNLVTSLATYDGPDPAGVRYQTLSADTVEIRIEEDTSADRETRHTTESVSFLAVEGNGLLTGISAQDSSPAPSPAPRPQGRDVTQHPFASDSIWNTPIGSNAVYVNAQIAPAKNVGTDVDHFYILDGNDPLRPLYSNGSWGAGRGTGYDYQGISLPIPDHLIIEDASNSRTPNNSAAFLMPDGRTLVQVNALTRDREGGHLYGQRLPYTPEVAVYEDIYGSGILGGHGGSGLSSIGGTLRLGELTGAAPIQHALKVNLWAKKYFSYTAGAAGGLGYRWPAVTADSHLSPGTYGGQVPELLNGSLLAISPDITPDSLGIQTEAGQKLFDAFQDYGAYVADDTGWDAHAIAVEKGVKREFRETYGHGFSEKGTDFFDDYMRLFSALSVVDNNALDDIGGGGTLRRPKALPLNNELNPALNGGEGSDSINGNTFANRIDGKEGHDLLVGENNHDFITGGKGNDSIFGGSGNDHLIGDSGRDLLRGDSGNDYLDGGSHRDTLEGGDGDDYLSGGTGVDHFFGGEGIDTVVESGEQNYVLTDDQLVSTWIDTLESIEQVILSGTASNNRLDAVAFNGSVELRGGRGHDELLGGAGNDQLVSSSGRDSLLGGTGADTFDLTGRSVFLASTRSNPYQSGDYALILDFTETEDQLALKGSAEQYRIGMATEQDESGLALYFDGNGDGFHHPNDEVVAIFKGISHLNLDNAQYH